MRRHQVSVADVLRGAFSDKVRQRLYSLELVKKRWAQVVGPELAKRSEPEALRDGVLTVRVLDVTWGKMIYDLQSRIVPTLNELVGLRLVKRLNFTKRTKLNGNVVSEVQPTPTRQLPTPPAIQAAASRVEDDELRAVLLRSATRYLSASQARKKG